MIRFNAKDGETRVVGLGITQDTFNKMLQGQAMIVELVHLGIPNARLVVVAGRDELSLTRELQTSIGQQTGVHIDPTTIIGKRQ